MAHRNANMQKFTDNILRNGNGKEKTQDYYTSEKSKTTMFQKRKEKESGKSKTKYTLVKEKKYLGELDPEDSVTKYIKTKGKSSYSSKPGDSPKGHTKEISKKRYDKIKKRLDVKAVKKGVGKAVSYKHD